ncbi:hypothetical protein BPUTEOMOX_3069 [methanotrophic endosymbiont of Bathymodiolus puteoserpentis (Logatchev)]|nr:hypothetical protein BPUTEOMOX_3069 [methanotrophic endosymbiont of Bathymodiolus puteoserpentis (Logatchev)]
MAHHNIALSCASMTHLNIINEKAIIPVIIDKQYLAFLSNDIA